MRVFQENTEYQGTPGEIAELFSLLDNRDKGTSETGFGDDDFLPLETVVGESQNLRNELANDPDYNPYPGVSKSPDNEDKSTIIVPDADLDTGVEIK